MDFANKIGISNAVMSHISSGRNKASTDLILNILNHFPDISTDWLLLGQGEMLRSRAGRIDKQLVSDLSESVADIKAKQMSALEKIRALETRILSLNK
jgi:hypothetical protein